jgi:GNAT superfamily N-acetyltransferase
MKLAPANAAAARSREEPARSAPTAFAADGYRAREVDAYGVPRLQAFLDANPDYHLLVTGEPPPAGEAAAEFAARPPEGWPYTKRWLLEIIDGDGSIVAIADVISDLLAPRVWHVGLFVVATRLHGQGIAARLYAALEAWMRAAGAEWLRLGVVAGNVRAERFWRARSYTEVRTRTGIVMGQRTNTVVVLVKPLADGALDDYFARVPRDRADAP